MIVESMTPLICFIMVELKTKNSIELIHNGRIKDSIEFWDDIVEKFEKIKNSILRRGERDLEKKRTGEVTRTNLLLKLI